LSDTAFFSKLVTDVIESHPNEKASYLAGKETLANWFFGQSNGERQGAEANPVVSCSRGAVDQVWKNNLLHLKITINRYASKHLLTLRMFLVL
jgi:hypothetical protein